MTDFGDFFCFLDGRLIRQIGDASAEVKLAVADSWLVEDGKARDIDAHFERFATWAKSADSGCEADLLPFFEAVREAIPKAGRWFPRIEYHNEAPEGQRLYLRLREAPAAMPTMTLWTYPEPDPRINPLVKGPDLSLGMQLRRAAQMHGADEAVLLDSDGEVSEGALSALVWWREDVLCAPGPEIKWLDSITRRQVFSIAESMGLETREESAAPEELAGLEIWGLSSLQGIRLVTEWVNLDQRVGQPKYFDSFVKRLKLLSASIQ
jgi:branched-subunit amino acid aminotransferase/4-amino-4-deoxychorismate lyase